MKILATLIFSAALLSNARADSFSEAFQNPPDSTKPGVYWYWLRDNISKEGITKDLEAMKRVGIGRAFIGNIDASQLGLGTVKMFSDEWWEATIHAIREARRLGIEIGIFNGPGWSLSAGPWVKPEQAMRSLAVSETKVRGPGKFSAVLPVPATPFTDVATLAIPDGPEDPDLSKAEITTSPVSASAALSDGDIGTTRDFPEGAATRQPFFVNIAFPQEVSVSSVTVHPARAPQKVECELQYKKPDGTYQSVKKFTVERSDRRNSGPMRFGAVVEAFPEVTAREFRLIFTDLVVGGRRRDDDDQQAPGIAEIAFSTAPRLERYVEKQLGQAFPSPHERWDSYLWKPQPAADGLDASEVRNISPNMDATGRLTWDIPDGNWTILRAGMIQTRVQNNSSTREGRGYETDKMNATHARAHFDAYLGKLWDRLSPDERKAWKYVIMDSYEVGPQNWTDELGKEFAGRYGYDPLPWLPVLTGRIVGTPDESDRFLWDLRRLVADKMAADYAGTLRKESNERGLKLWMENYGHFGFPGEALLYGGQADEVAGEFWAAGDLGSFEMRIASSAAHIYGKPVVAAEAFTSGRAPWTHSPWSLKQRGDWAMAEGANHFVLHLYIHQSDERAPGINAWFNVEFNRHNTWFEEMGDWIASFRRAQAVLQQGHFVADLAYFTGEDAPKQTGILEPPLPPGHNYDFINGDVIRRDLEVRNGRFVLPDGMSYRLLVLPPLETMRPELLQKIGALVKAGGAILGEPPQRSPSLENFPQCDEEVRKLAGEIWKGIDGKTVTSGRHGEGFVFRGTDAASALKALGVAPALEGIGERSGIGEPGMTWIQRQTEDADAWFISNQDDEKKSLDLTFRAAGGDPELWDPVTGEMRPLPQFTRQADGRVTVPLEFLPRQSYFVAFRRNGSPAAPAGGVNFPPFETALELAPAWTVTFDPKRNGPGEVAFAALTDWTAHADDRIKYFSGTAVYRAPFSFEAAPDRRYFLNLGGFESIARVRLNGQDLGTIWTRPGRVEITKALQPGANELEIAVTNTWNNRLLGDSKLPADQRLTWTSVDPGVRPATPLLPSGLTGPVTIEELKQ